VTAFPADERRELLGDELPETCRRCELSEQRPRIPGQFLCPTCAREVWGDEKTNRVIRETREAHGLDGAGH